MLLSLTPDPSHMKSAIMLGPPPSQPSVDGVCWCPNRTLLFGCPMWRSLTSSTLKGRRAGRNAIQEAPPRCGDDDVADGRDGCDGFDDDGALL